LAYFNNVMQLVQADTGRYGRLAYAGRFAWFQ